MRRLLIVLFFVACAQEQTTTTEAPNPQGQQPPPSKEQAREMIAKSAELSEFEFTNAAWSATISTVSMSPVTRAEVKDLESAGWLRSDSGNLELTDRSGPDKRFIIRENGILDVVPLAKKEMGEVAAVRPNPDGTIAVDFTWKWLPNEVGASFKSGPVHDRLAGTQNATATFMWDGTNWMLLKIDRR